MPIMVLRGRGASGGSSKPWALCAAGTEGAPPGKGGINGARGEGIAGPRPGIAPIAEGAGA
jgi:hypothetical protein